MNFCEVDGWIQGPPEVRVTQDSRRILNFEIAVEGKCGPYVHVGLILQGVEFQMIFMRAPKFTSVVGSCTIVCAGYLSRRTRSTCSVLAKSPLVAGKARPQAKVSQEPHGEIDRSAIHRAAPDARRVRNCGLRCLPEDSWARAFHTLRRARGILLADVQGWRSGSRQTRSDSQGRAPTEISD